MDDYLCEEICINYEAVNEVKSLMLDSVEIQSLADIFKILGDPTRIKIIYALTKKELCVCDIATVLTMSSSAISHQLRVLRAARLVKHRKDGKIVYYSLDDSHITNLFKEGLDHIKHS